MYSDILPSLAAADLSDGPRAEPAPAGWTGPLVPNFSEWLPGDILLVHSSGSAKDMAVEASQFMSFNRATRQGSKFVHAAVYVGGGEMIDLTDAHGVARRSVWEYCSVQPIALRRVAGVDAAQRAAIVVRADQLARARQSYSWWGLALSKLLPKQQVDPENLFCSTLVARVVQQGCGKNLAAQHFYRPMYPGTLAEHQSLDIVLLEWRPRV